MKRKVGGHDRYVEMGFEPKRLAAAMDRFPQNDNPTYDEFLNVLVRDQDFYDGMVVEVVDGGVGPMPDIHAEGSGSCAVCFEEGELSRLGGGCLCVNPTMCAACLKSALAVSSACPMCHQHVRAMQGPCPEGQASVKWFKSSLLGHEGHGHFSILFRIKDGKQKEGRDPNPGKKFWGKEEYCFLPDTERGRELGGRLLRAFVRGHVFTIGHSLTRNVDNVVTFNGIHMKTMRRDSPYGYPDKTYLNRLDSELASKGF